MNVVSSSNSAVVLKYSQFKLEVILKIIEVSYSSTYLNDIKSNINPSTTPTYLTKR